MSEKKDSMQGIDLTKLHHCGKKRESYGDLVDRLWFKVKTHMNWDDEKCSLWWRTKNPMFGNVSPDDYLSRRPDKIERVIDALISESSP